MSTASENAFHRTNVYSQMSVVLDELKKRRSDPGLKAKVDALFSDKGLRAIGDTPRAVLSRPIFTPNLELRYYVDLATDAGLDPLLLEYPGKFVARNNDKYNLCKLNFFAGYGKNMGIRSASVRVVDFNAWEGKDLASVTTATGETLPQFHHRLLYAEFPELAGKVCDFTDWFNEARVSSEHYYFNFLSLFIRDAVLFENYLLDDPEELHFFTSKILPSFAKVEEHFGVRPLIYPLLPIENERYSTWLSYPTHVRRLLAPDAEAALSHEHGI